MKSVSGLFALTIAVLARRLPPILAVADDAAKASKDAGVVLGDPEGPLTPEEKAEKEARQACKVDLCKAFHSKDPAGSDIACHVIPRAGARSSSSSWSAS